MALLSEEFETNRFIVAVNKDPKVDAGVSLNKKTEEDFLQFIMNFDTCSRKYFFVHVLEDVLATARVIVSNKAPVPMLDFIAFPEKVAIENQVLKVNIDLTRTSALKITAETPPSMESMLRSLCKLVSLSSRISKTENFVSSNWRYFKRLFHLLDEKYADVCKVSLFLMGVLAFKNTAHRILICKSVEEMDFAHDPTAIHPRYASLVFNTDDAFRLLCLKALVLSPDFFAELADRTTFFQKCVDIEVRAQDPPIPIQGSFIASLPGIVADLLEWDMDLVVDRVMLYFILSNVFSMNAQFDIQAFTSSSTETVVHMRPFYVIDQSNDLVIFEHQVNF
jgi:hypothetical protein